MGQEILGNNASDSILGSAGADTIIPLNGQDTVFGGDGDDGINGFMAPDGPRLYSASGTKWFDGEAGNDLVVGGAMQTDSLAVLVTILCMARAAPIR